MYYAKHSSMNGIIICINGEKSLMKIIFIIISEDKTTYYRALLPLNQTILHDHQSN